MPIDLHTHSTASDGTESPAELIGAAAAAGLGTVAITDHDTTAGWGEASRAARQHGVALVRGAEISCQWWGVGVHMLAYLHDPADAALLAELDQTRDDRFGRARRMVAAIAEDYPLEWSDVEAQVGVDATVGRPHIADALVARGHVRDRDEAFAGILRTGSPYYIGHYAPDADHAVRLIRAAGGVPVIAHPRASRRARTVSDDVLALLVEAGMAGIEARHRDHTPEDVAAMQALAADLGVFTTGSSDYHGTGKLNRIGENTTAPEALERIEAQATGTPVLRP